MTRSAMPTYDEAQTQKFEGYIDPESYNRVRKDQKLLKFTIIATVIILLMGALTMYQNNELNKLKVYDAYLTCSLIDAQEDHLLLKYGLFPKDVGLGELEEAWEENPCEETSKAYSEALSHVIDQLESKKPEFLRPDELSVTHNV